MPEGDDALNLRNWLTPGNMGAAVAILASAAGAAAWFNGHFVSAEEARAMELRLNRQAAWAKVQALRQETIVSRNRVNDCAVKVSNGERMSPLEQSACRQYDDEFRNATRRFELAQRRAEEISTGGGAESKDEEK